MSSKRTKKSSRDGRARSKTSRSARTGSPDIIGLTSLSDTKRRGGLRGKWARERGTASAKKSATLLDRIHAKAAAKINASRKVAQRDVPGDARERNVPKSA